MPPRHGVGHAKSPVREEIDVGIKAAGGHVRDQKLPALPKVFGVHPQDPDVLPVDRRVEEEKLPSPQDEISPRLAVLDLRRSFPSAAAPP